MAAIGQNKTGPKDPPTDPIDEEPLGGGAPLSGGTLLLVIIGAAYGSYKLSHAIQENSKLQD